MEHFVIASVILWMFALLIGLCTWTDSFRGGRYDRKFMAFLVGLISGEEWTKDKVT